MTLGNLTGPQGAVIIDVVTPQGEKTTVTFNLKPLSISDYAVLHAEMVALASRRKDKIAREKIDLIGQVEKPTWAHRQVVSDLTNVVLSEPTDYDMNLVRCELEGLRAELWHFARTTQPNLSRDEVAACVTSANLREVRNKIDALMPKKDETAHKS